MNRHTLEALDFHRILEAVAEGAHSPPGRQVILRLEARHDLAAIQDQQESLREMMALLARESRWPAIEIGDPEPGLRKLGIEGAVLEPPELLQLARLAEIALGCRRVIQRDGGRASWPRLARLLETTWDDAAFVQACTAAFDEAGNVRDEASRELRRVRRRLQIQRRETSEAADRLLSRYGPLPDGTESYATLRGGRYVVAIPAANTRRLPGILHDRSSSGRTVFVEPMDLVEANNALRDLEDEERKEIRRVLRRLTEGFRAKLGPLRATAEVLAQLDAWSAIARWSLRWQGALPDLVEAGAGSLRLRGARHPLLCRAVGSLEAVVALDLELDADLRGLVVSGPNMGGKSVLLRTVGVTCTMALCGLPVLAREGTTIPVWDDVLVDLGDEQSLEADLSTFAAHLRNLREMDLRATHMVIVLVDELGSGTDPQEGAALGVTLLEELVRRGCFFIITTHMSAFKEFAARTPGVGNGSMEFDPATLCPRYRFLPGVPGRSHAFEVAAGEGWPVAYIEAARRKLEAAAQGADDLLREIEELREELRRQRIELQEQLSEALQAKASYQGLAGRMRERLDRIRAERAVEENRLLRDLRDLSRRMRQALDRGGPGDLPAPEAARSLVEETRATLRHPPRRRVHRGGRRPRLQVEDLVAGREVWCEDVRSRVKIDGLPDGRGRVWIRAGALRIQVPLVSLRQLPGPEGSPPRGPQERSRFSKYPSEPEDTLQVESEIDLRGLDRVESLRRLDLYLDRARLGRLPRVRIIHGIGKGVLMEEVTRFLEAQPFVASYRRGESGEGGDGVTIVFLSGAVEARGG